jgi:hypothetical protein
MPPKKTMKIVTKEEMEEKRKKADIKKRQNEEKIIQDELDEYSSNFSDFELKVLEIAKRQLESSFSLEKSIGFLEWKKSKCN